MIFKGSYQMGVDMCDLKHAQHRMEAQLTRIEAKLDKLLSLSKAMTPEEERKVAAEINREANKIGKVSDL